MLAVGSLDCNKMSASEVLQSTLQQVQRIAKNCKELQRMTWFCDRRVLIHASWKKSTLKMSKRKGASSDSVQLQFLLGSSIRRKHREAKQQQQQQQQQQQLPTVRIIAPPPHRSLSNIDVDDIDFSDLSSITHRARSGRLRPRIDISLEKNLTNDEVMWLRC